MPTVLSRKAGGGSGGGAPSGPAGGDLGGTYPNPTIDWASQELDYVEITASVTVSATSAATATTCITGNAVVYDGATRVCVEVYSPMIESASTALSSVFILLYDGATQVGTVAGFGSGDGGSNPRSMLFSRTYLTPSAASHTYSVRAYRGQSNGSFTAGAGGDDAFLPAYLRVAVA